jgi:hypothetical protein
VSDLYGFAGADSFVIRIDRLVTDAVYLWGCVVVGIYWLVGIIYRS